VLTTNLAFRDWPTIFPIATSAVALIDRVILHADKIAIQGRATSPSVVDRVLKAH
jgi:hypothetical protein